METVVLFQWKLSKELLNEEDRLINCPICLAETQYGNWQEVMDGLFVYHCWNCKTHVLKEG